MTFFSRDRLHSLRRVSRLCRWNDMLYIAQLGFPFSLTEKRDKILTRSPVQVTRFV
ncbi:MAG: hypothetical protein ACR2LR_17865 [Hassallia sp.]